MRQLMIGLMALTVFGCSNDTVTIQVDEEFKDYVAEINQAANVLLERCPNLQKYWSDFKSVTGRYVSNDQFDQFGDTEIATFVFVVRQFPDRIPDDFNAEGHEIIYTLAAGRNPGIHTKKAQGQMLCGGMEITPDRDGFLPADSLAFMNRH